MTITHDDMLAWIKACAEILSENRDYLIDLDAAIGDADHGANMDRGFKAVLEKMPEMANQDIAGLLKMAGMTLVSTVGGAGGPLYGTFFLQLGMKLTGKTEVNLADWAGALEAGVMGVKARGKANAGDKTMLDALLPAVDALNLAIQEGKTLSQAVEDSAQAAKQGMEATIPMVARKGRASYLGERSAGHQDPGATSSYLLLKSAADTWNRN